MQADLSWSAVLAHHAIRTPDAPMTVFEGTTTTYGQMAERVASLAGGLAERGVGRGDVVGLLSYNCPEMLETIFAANHLGAIAMPINWRLAAPEVRYILEHSGAAGPGVRRGAGPAGRRGDRRARGRHHPSLRRRRRRRAGLALADLRASAAPVARRARGRRRRPPAHVHLGHHRPAQGRDAHPRQPGVEEPRPPRRVRLHQRRPRLGLRAAVPRRRPRPHDHHAHRGGGDGRSSTAPSTPLPWSTSWSGRGSPPCGSLPRW